MSVPKSEREENIEHIRSTITSVRDQFQKIDGRVKVVRMGNQLYVENAERYNVYPQVNRLMKQIDKLNEFLEKHSNDDLLDLVYERYEL